MEKNVQQEQSKVEPKTQQTESKIDPVVFGITFVIGTLFVLWGVLGTDSMERAVNVVFKFMIDKFGWYYLIYGSLTLFLSLVVGFTKYGDIKLGKPDEEPEYSAFSWIAMLFSAGMGVGLVFFGVAEPITHYANPPWGQAETAKAALLSMRYVFFHWGFHPWSMYALFGLMIAYFSFRRGLPQLPSSTLYPLIGEKGIKGIPGKAFDTLCAVVTLFGIAIPLGLGAQQINSGLHNLFGIPNNTMVAVIIIALVTVAFIISALTGLDKGIKYLSSINVNLFSILTIMMIVLGPTIFIAEYFTQSFGGYLQNIFDMSFYTSPVKQSSWPGWWTMFYWAWWVLWVPLVGGFIARISRGRTIREFVLGVIGIPSLVSFIWFAVMGGAAIWMEQFGAGGIIGPVQNDIASAFFVTLNKFPFGNIMSFMAVILISTFFVTSADSGTFVMGMLTSHGALEPSKKVKVTWGIFEAFIAAIMLVVGGLAAGKTIAITSAFPFVVVIWLSVIAFFKALREDYDLIEQGEFIGKVDLE